MNHGKDTDGNSTKRNRQRAYGEEERSHVPNIEATWPAMDNASMIALAQAFQGFLHRDGGYLKVKRDVDGPMVHFTWVFTYGPWKKYYVYCRIEYWAAGVGLAILEDKIVKVDLGQLTPTPDRFQG